MKLENQVCTRQQAEKLKELGVQGKSLLVYKGKNKLPEAMSLSERKAKKSQWVSAWTVAELGIMLQARLQPGHSFMGLDRMYWYHTWQKYGKIQPILGPYDSEAQARAAMLIHLLETKYLTADKVNARLEKEGGV